MIHSLENQILRPHDPKSGEPDLLRPHDPKSGEPDFDPMIQSQENQSFKSGALTARPCL